MHEYLRAASLARLLGVHRSTLWRWAKELPDFPKPMKVTEGVTLWRVEEVQAWLQRKGGTVTNRN